MEDAVTQAQQSPAQFVETWEVTHEQGHLLRKARTEMQWIDLGSVPGRQRGKETKCCWEDSHQAPRADVRQV